jgi:uncharacterized membrane protein YeaQ/YmgE (transglycosylase-associated protein family)
MFGLINLLWALFIASIVGAIGARLAGRANLGCLASIALGFIGALLGAWIASRMELPLGPTLGDIPIIWAIVGAALFTAVLNLASGKR